mmetsp:Transcript_72508/g.167977  ORF Transcript_72508/g.167977 Transcript_72508/m.167977 type:complete len:211 (-) Transcript_72508:897-1529(-)
MHTTTCHGTRAANHHGAAAHVAQACTKRSASHACLATADVPRGVAVPVPQAICPARTGTQLLRPCVEPQEEPACRAVWLQLASCPQDPSGTRRLGARPRSQQQVLRRPKWQQLRPHVPEWPCHHASPARQAEHRSQVWPATGARAPRDSGRPGVPRTTAGHWVRNTVPQPMRASQRASALSCCGRCRCTGGRHAECTCPRSSAVQRASVP